MEYRDNFAGFPNINYYYEFKGFRHPLWIKFRRNGAVADQATPGNEGLSVNHDHCRTEKRFQESWRRSKNLGGT
ncbi:unnamed protein product [Lupinus luteus]|uniref:Uncharacterized protein n=1 Tax=Lupinus luteus TaxID=3873 RepID=A0AAV1WL65_LUPLU